MYLHELGDSEASFTKEEMHQGKHQEYEKRLHDALIAQMQQQSQQSSTTGNPATTSPENEILTSPSGSSTNNSSGTSNDIMKSSSNSGDSKDLTSNGNGNGTVNNGQIQKEAWPCLSTSPVTIKENNKTSTKGSECCTNFSFNHYF
jgi:CCR4-NOT transcription complex subunit 4